ERKAAEYMEAAMPARDYPSHPNESKARLLFRLASKLGYGKFHVTNKHGLKAEFERLLNDRDWARTPRQAARSTEQREKSTKSSRSATSTAKRIRATTAPSRLPFARWWKKMQALD